MGRDETGTDLLRNSQEFSFIVNLMYGNTMYQEEEPGCNEAGEDEQNTAQV